MNGDTKYLHETLGESVKLLREYWVKKIILMDETKEDPVYTLDFTDVAPEDTPERLKALMETDEVLKGYLGYRTKRVEHDVNKITGDKEMTIHVSPITHVVDLSRRSQSHSNQVRYAIAGTPRKSFSKVFEEHLAHSMASENKSNNEVK